MTDQACGAAIAQLLTLYPDCEMRAADVWAELDQRWDAAQVAQVLAELVRAGHVTQLNDAGEAWYSVAVAKLDAANWPSE